MADRSQQTEQATPRRLEKAREEGRYPVSREALSTVAFAVTTLLVIRLLPDALDRFAELLRLTVSKAFSHRFSVRTALGLWHSIALGSFVPMLLAGAATLALVIGAQLAMTGFGMAGSRLTLDWNRLNPLPRLRELPAQNLWQVVQALAVLGVFAALLAIQMRDWIPAMLLLPLQPFRTALASVSETMVSLLHKAIFLFAILGAIDLIRQRAKYSRDLRMSKQEIREEVKESDGNPHVKQKIRRLQRDASRRRMMEKVPQATAVIVNPTHFSVAILYDPAGMAAPKVVAKGKNYLARRIREIALAHEVPIVENPPLARSLYKSVEVGHEIPANLYRAVAEVLAYIFRLMNGRISGG